MTEKAETAKSRVIQAFDGGEKGKARLLYNDLTDKQRDSLAKERPDVAALLTSLNMRS